ncbi:NAD(P)H-hydrate dehydratase [Erythrobacter sp. Alg231-14]|uniref:NAD(P)H-hydrate dehydratase n=1 Tax=Erythrobacter sp. Alg231-14 TaxID=1922225 RepID=UPI000D559930
MNNTQVLTTAQMRGAEDALFKAGMSVDALMEIAAGKAAEWVRRIAAGRSITVLCGPGNNGGDGYVMARILRDIGLAVKVIAPVEPKTDAAQNALKKWGGPVSSSGGAEAGDVLVDCLFGCGLSRPLSGEHALLLRDLAARHDTVIAIDVPSGIQSDTGALLNDKLPYSDVTLALGAWKFAHWSLPGRALMGQRKLIPIGIDTVEDAAQLLGRPSIKAPALDAHKYRRGLAAIVGGAMPGAARLSAEAAMRSGAGYVKLIEDVVDPARNPALVADGAPVDKALSDSRIDAVLVGPGLGRGETASTALRKSLKARVPTVLDADALVALTPSLLPDDLPILATPHDGELDTLCRNFAVLAETRRDRAAALAKVSRMVILAKGPDTVIAAPDGRIAVVPPASSWLSVAGTGDVLAGIAVSRMATGVDTFVAASQAVWLHGEAARQCGPAFTALDLAQTVSSAMASQI